MKTKLTVLPGDGIGPEVITQAMRVLRTVADLCGHEIEAREFPVGGVAIKQSQSPFPRATMDACLESNAVLLGAVGGPEYDNLPRNMRPETGLLQLRTALGGYANLRPAIAYPSLSAGSPLRAEVTQGANVLIIRELLGGLYFGEPREKTADYAFNTMRYTVPEIQRVARIAFEQARKRKRKLTSIDKANVLDVSQLWRDTVIALAAEYPDVTLDHMYVDAAAMHLVLNPRRFDVIVTENLFGDILSDEAAVITGSLGMLASATIGGQVGLYEPVHGSAPDIAGKNIANPLGAIATVAMLLRHSMGLNQEADDVEAAINQVLEQGFRTADLHRGAGTQLVSTTEMGERVEAAVAEKINRRHSYHAV
ncbi:MAG TPA: 3-isopropylmalate dehydrogenase [Terriglobales bacterium]|jgi:3-isopropylmalate dehydrogenase|nr:3-isopropylmalate dehydrogenase [Terriglobales bacterium]